MSRTKTISDEDVVQRAMVLFWKKGFEATSINDLVDATGGNRFGLYAAFGDKRGLFLQSLNHYAKTFVTRALADVERPAAGIKDIRGYFERLVDLAEAWGLPSQGCLMANSMTEIAPHDSAILEKVRAHFERVRRGFEHALCNAKKQRDLPKEFDPAKYAQFLAVSAQGLWAYSRICNDAAELRCYVSTLLHPISRTNTLKSQRRKRL
jgi:TetR/AcrR family transcriptional regulator, transcriptional repressor for nem operon